VPVVPHAYHFFDSVGLLLRRDAEQADPRTGASAHWEMSPEEARGYIDAIGHYLASPETADVMLPSPTSMALLGGEPLAFPEQLQLLLERTAKHKIAVEVWSTPSWVRDKSHAVDVLTQASAHMHALRIHINRRLLDEAGSQRLEWLLDACRAVGVAIYIRCGVSANYPLPRELFAYEAVNSDSTFLSVLPLRHDQLPVALATNDPGSSEATLSVVPRQRCAEKLGFFVAPGGDVFPCLAGVGVPQLRLGGLQNSSVAQIMATAKRSSVLMQLHACGPAVLYDLPDPDDAGPRFVDACDFHRTRLLSAPAVTETRRAGRAVPPANV
jgi:hypothetical protein